MKPWFLKKMFPQPWSLLLEDGNIVIGCTLRQTTPRRKSGLRHKARKERYSSAAVAICGWRREQACTLQHRTTNCNLNEKEAP
jgi:hypothetical protein